MIYLSNRDGGSTDEAGHLKFMTSAFTGNVLEGLTVAANSPLGMSVKVAAGTAKVDYSNYAYPVWIPTGGEETVTIATANASNPRIDRIVLYVDRAASTQIITPNNPGIPKLAVIAGTPGAVPVRPTNAAVNTAINNNPYIDLADVRVNAAVTQITNANITDVRTMASARVSEGSITSTQLGSSSVTTTKLDTASVTAPKIDFGGAGTGVWWEEIGRATNAGQTSISVTGFPLRKYIQIIATFSPSTSMDVNMRFGNGSIDTGNNYAWRHEVNGAADTTGTTTNVIQLLSASSAVNYIFNGNVINVANSNKSLVALMSSNAGIASAPAKRVVTGTWGNAVDQINAISIIASTGNLGAAEIVVLGHN